MSWKNEPPWLDIDVPSRTLPWPERLAAVLRDLDVENAARYRPTVVDGKPRTFCNIFVTDVIRNMGVKAPSHWMTGKGEPARIGRGIEISANRLCPWFNNHGPTYGWYSTDRDAAVEAAERGHLVVCGWVNQAGPGHIAIVLNQVEGETRITQAGADNYKNVGLMGGFGKKPVSFWVQADRESNEAPHHA